LFGQETVCQLFESTLNELHDWFKDLDAMKRKKPLGIICTNIPLFGEKQGHFYCGIMLINTWQPPSKAMNWEHTV